MNHQEAIKIIKELSLGLREDGIVKQANDLAIESLRMSIPITLALEPFHDIMRHQICYKIKCPTCSERFGVLEFLNDKERVFADKSYNGHCFNCGQALNWEQ